jgi:hypothetical protein
MFGRTPQEFTEAFGDGGAKVFAINSGDKIEFY